MERQFILDRSCNINNMSYRQLQNIANKLAQQEQNEFRKQRQRKIRKKKFQISQDSTILRYNSPLVKKDQNMTLNQSFPSLLLGQNFAQDSFSAQQSEYTSKEKFQKLKKEYLKVRRELKINKEIAQNFAKYYKSR